MGHLGRGRGYGRGRGSGHGRRRPRGDVRAAILVLLEDEGLIRFEETGERRQARLTDAGAAYVEANRKALGTPWDSAAAGVTEEMADLRRLVWQLGAAVREVEGSGDAEQHARARAAPPRSRWSTPFT